ncbi:methyltransferase domain-containing protein [Streptomyces montanisoli]|uniref:NAD(P)/FAD-dependent oxidoreductase n=1 Tax=Streptomyces montanisoli TaxID=2798581 RepID=A0A940RW41_9ACTN|nr:methyltransferase domain-containing protein [Streptomyces montanisoli]MBP0459040.1 NAD(P)/FAD-dependent oxidoreductase [Streptomyces montanisoli]
MSAYADRYDVVVIGGGAAGLGGALTLARARRSVLVVDGGEPRNAPAEAVHGYPGREGTPPAELLAAARAEVAGYGGAFADGTVASVKPLPGGGRFLVVRDDGTEVVARRLLLATGLVDEVPEVPGIDRLWGRDVLHCPYCHGWEVRGTPIGVLATGPLAAHQALLWRQWSDDVTLFLHTAPEPDDETYERLAARGIAVVDGEVTALEVVDGRLAGVRVGEDLVVPRTALAVAPRFTARYALLDGLGLTTAEQTMAGHVVGSYVPSDPTGATDVPGVWVAGNATVLTEQVIGAAAAGVRAGAAINADLLTEDTDAAVMAYRSGGAPQGAQGEPLGGRDFWDARYRRSERIWSGDPNTELVKEVAGLTPGRALDLGCGEGADAVWLAGRGWEVTAVDISPVALERARAHAVDAGVADRIDWRTADLGAGFPAGTFDLVSAQFLHSPGEMDREKVLRSAAAAVAPGGVLLVAGHSGGAPWEPGHADLVLPTPAEVVASLRLPDGEWEVLRCEDHERVQQAPDGTRMVRTDNTVKVRRVAK